MAALWYERPLPKSFQLTAQVDETTPKGSNVIQ
jgi:hypothetical protein